MPELDLDALRAQRDAARREANKEPPVLRIGGELIELPVELPLDLLWSIEERVTSNREVARTLFGEVAFEKFMATRPTQDDWKAVDDFLQEVYFPGKAKSEGQTTAGE